MSQEDVRIKQTGSVKDVLKKLDRTAKKVLLVVDDENRLLGTITDGDIRRYILSGKSLEENISGIYNKNPIYVMKEEFSTELAKETIVKNKIELLPILDEERKIVDFATWDQLFLGGKNVPLHADTVSLPVVIMAGGKGTRMEPFTRVFPKPLIPVGDRSVVEIIIERFRGYGCREYFMTVNHKSEMIEAYFNSLTKDYEMTFIKEKSFFGTAGSLKLLNGRIEGSFIVSNCDVMVRADYQEVINLHEEQDAWVTVLSSIQHHRVPYGVVKFREGGEIVDIIEKPEYSFTVNTGVYILNEKCLHLIPEGEYFDMPELIKTAMGQKKKVLVYPVNENDYIDIGQWEEYQRSIEKLQMFK